VEDEEIFWPSMTSEGGWRRSQQHCDPAGLHSTEKLWRFSHVLKPMETFIWKSFPTSKNLTLLLAPLPAIDVIKAGALLTCAYIV
jgi:hypothetical protein